MKKSTVWDSARETSSSLQSGSQMIRRSCLIKTYQPTTETSEIYLRTADGVEKRRHSDEEHDQHYQYRNPTRQLFCLSLRTKRPHKRKRLLYCAKSPSRPSEPLCFTTIQENQFNSFDRRSQLCGGRNFI